MEWIILIIFITGYFAIALEHSIKINKAAIALVTGVLSWTIYIINHQTAADASHKLLTHFGEISGILFFLLGAMTIVELIDVHNGFDIITNRLTTTSKRKLLWIIGFLSFFMSAILDNLTTTIVMVSLIKKITDERNDRLFFAGIIIVAANAGGAWSPIGDVTTTMLWIGEQVTAVNIILQLIVPSLVCLLIPLIFLNFKMKGDITKPAEIMEITTPAVQKDRNIIFFTGLILLMAVPVFKTITKLPPFMGMLMALGIMWIVTEIIHKRKEEDEKGFLSVAYALRKIDSPSILFFLGILLAVAALQETGFLLQSSQWLNHHIKNESLIAVTIGLLSSIVDNVPLVAASQGMYSLQQYPTDSFFWGFLAYATGTGGSILIIGSAAGIAAMGLEKIDFFWYLKKISLWALIGYLSGAVVFILQHWLTR